MVSHVASRLTAFDRDLAGNLSRKGRMIAGVDEAGRGPLAGPVVAAAVIFYDDTPLAGLNDSKKMSCKARERLFYQILAKASVGLGTATEAEIDEINIYQASRLAMVRAVFSLNRTPDLLLIDGNAGLNVSLAQRTVVGGDAKSACIAAASVVAKVYRDAWMSHLDELYPGYGFSKHKGYPTPEHKETLLQQGPSPVHRKSFAPVREVGRGFRDVFPEAAQ